MPEAKDYKIMELEAENEDLKSQIIEMQKLRIAELEMKLSKFLETGVENGYMSRPLDTKHKITLRTSSEVARFLEQKSIKKVEHVKEIDNPS